MTGSGHPAEAGHGRARARPSVRALITVFISLASLGLLLWVAPPGQVLNQIGHMKLRWVALSVGLEVASCLSYVVVFRRFFPEPRRGVSHRVAWIAMGAGALLPGGNISSAAATGVLLRRHGIGGRALVERCAGLLCLLTAIGFVVNGLAGLFLLFGLLGGPHDLSHAGIPILVSAGVLLTAAAVALFVRRWGEAAPRFVRGVAAGLEGAWRAAGTAHWRLIGGAGFICFDMGALWAACAATGHSIGLPALIVAYCIGYLTTTIPIPAGLGVLDSGLTAALVLYGMSPTASVGAVLVYHAISIWVPATGGLIAWLPTQRGRRGRVAVPTTGLKPAPSRP